MGFVARIVTFSFIASLGVAGWAAARKVAIDSEARLQAGTSLLRHARKTGSRSDLLAAGRHLSAAMRAYLPRLSAPRRATLLMAEVVEEADRLRAGDEARQLVADALDALDALPLPFTPLEAERAELAQRLDAHTAATTEQAAEAATVTTEENP